MDTELVERSKQLGEYLAHGNFADFCKQKTDQCTDQYTWYVWYFIKAHFEANPRAEMLNLLGYQPDVIAKKFSHYIKGDVSLANQMANASRWCSGL